MNEKQNSYTIKCTKEEREAISMLCYKMKLNRKERIAQVVLRALEKLKECEEC